MVPNEKTEGTARTGKLLIVSNRLPFTAHRRQGQLQLDASSGGLSTGLASFYRTYDALWIGWPGIDKSDVGADRERLTQQLLAEKCFPVFLSRHDVDEYYNRFSSGTIWPLFHYFPLYATYSNASWTAYEKVNRMFCDAVVERWQQGDTIWVHDFHLMLLPRMLRERLPDPTIGFFLHIPFPSLELFRLLPWRVQLLEGLLGADLVGFHTWDYAGHFMASVRFLLGHDSSMGRIVTGDRVARVDVFPMGIDYERFAEAARKPEVSREIKTLDRSLDQRKVLLSVDRLDYTKGILRRLEVFALFLERHPEYREKLTYVLVVVPSRTMVAQYAQLKQQIDESVGAINGKYGTIHWVPISYMYRSVPFNSLVALYRRADVALVTPVRDGMNLVAKEYLASRTDKRGVLVLSETAGAAKELGEALTINVNDDENFVSALETALAMPDAEQSERLSVMQTRLRRYNIRRWVQDYLEALQSTSRLQEEMGVKPLGVQARKKLVKAFQQSQKRLLLLDYDGTLVPLASRPSMASPPADVLDVVSRLAGEPGTEVVVVSGRDRDSLDGWFSKLPISLVAEHGVWLKPKAAGEWTIIEPLTNEWKEQVRPILELDADRTPGSFVEEKDFSLVWHYRGSESRLGELRARELAAHLGGLTTNLNLQVLEGSKVVEVKNAGVNKGRAVARWLSAMEPDFVLAIGDDWTDEDMFKALPEGAWSIRVGLSGTAAKYNLGSPAKVVALLQELLTPEEQASVPAAGRPTEK